jgi:hypothetical protein
MIAQPIEELLRRLHADAMYSIERERSAYRAGCINGSWPVGMLADDALILVEYIRQLDQKIDELKWNQSNQTSRGLFE